MHGNVMEWCNEIYYKYTIDSNKDQNLMQFNNYDNNRICRGGSYSNDDTSCRSAYRTFSPSNRQYNNVGFRIVRRP